MCRDQGFTSIHLLDAHKLFHHSHFIHQYKSHIDCRNQNVLRRCNKGSVNRGSNTVNGWLDVYSGIATGVARGAVCHTWQQKICQKSRKRREKSWKIGKKSGKIGEKKEKSERNDKNREISFTLPLLTDRAGYAPGCLLYCLQLTPSPFSNTKGTILYLNFIPLQEWMWRQKNVPAFQLHIFVVARVFSHELTTACMPQSCIT